MGDVADGAREGVGGDQRGCRGLEGRRPVWRVFGCLFAVAVVAILLVGEPAVAQQSGATAAFPWKEGDAPPAFAGVKLGDRPAAVIAALGKPRQSLPIDGRPDVVALRYPARGMFVVVTHDDGVSLVTVRQRQSGAIDGVRVGDSRSDVVARWGKPPEHKGSVGMWSAGPWGVLITLDPKSDAVQELTLGWNDKKFPGADPNKMHYYRGQ